MAKIIGGQAIETRYVPATNTKPGRVKAKAEAGSVTISWDHELDEKTHAKAAQMLADKMGWTGPRYGNLYGGASGGRSGSGYVFIFIRPDDLEA